MKNGLIGSPSSRYKYLKNPVFAHNRPIPRKEWYPFVIDSWDWTFEDKFTLIEMNSYDYLKFQSLSKGYEVWEIDTFKLKNRSWYIDQVASDDFLDGINYPYYVMSEGHIPVHALKLYQFHEEHYFKKGIGVAHVGSDFRIVNPLELKNNDQVAC